MLTAAKLRAVVTADTSDGKKSLKEFGDEVTRTRQHTEREVGTIANVFKGTFAANLLSDAVRGLASGVTSLVTGAVSALTSMGREALNAVASYESLSMSLNQLTASQLKQAGVTDDMAEALRLAAEPTKDLIRWTEILAIKSPYTSQGIAGALRMAEAFGFSQAEAKRLTQALVDFTSGSGMSSDVMQRITMSMGQMVAAGKLTGREIRELALAGLPIKAILADAFGVTTSKMEDMVEKGTVPLGKAMEAIVRYLEDNFAGAASRATYTWNGLLSSLGEIKEISLRSLFGGVFEAVRPELGGLVDYLGSDTFKNKLASIGTAIGDALKTGIATAKTMIQGLLDAGFLGNLGETVKGLTSGDFATNIADLLGGIEFGIAEAIVQAKYVAGALWEAGKMVADVIREFLANFGELATLFGNVIDTKIASFTAQIQSAVRMDASPAYRQAAQQAMAESDLASSNFSDYVGQLGAKVQGTYSDMTESIQGLQKQRDIEIAVIDEARSKYDKEIETKKRLEQANDALAYGEVINTRTLKQSAETTAGNKVADALSANKVFGPAVDGAGDAGKAAGKKFADALQSAAEQAVNKIRGYLSEGISVSIGLGKMPGTEPFAAGDNGPTENIYRLQDIYAHLGKQGQTEDTVKWYQEWFGGMAFEDARANAERIVTKFQQGNFDDEVLKYIDTEKLRQVALGRENAAASQDRLAAMIGGDGDLVKAMMGKDLAGKGYVLDDATAKTVAQMLKTGVINGIGQIAGEAPTVVDALMGTVAQAPTDKNGANPGSGVIPALAAGIKKSLEENPGELKAQGAKAWGVMEEGMMEAAKQSGALSAMVQAMVDSALKAYIPPNK